MNNQIENNQTKSISKRCSLSNAITQTGTDCAQNTDVMIRQITAPTVDKNVQIGENQNGQHEAQKQTQEQKQIISTVKNELKQIKKKQTSKNLKLKRKEKMKTPSLKRVKAQKKKVIQAFKQAKAKTKQLKNKIKKKKRRELKLKN
ncbi:Hypothetical_protein [Hexamita inflata]|uniref:Hypothetical_protein n=1 Tax=Hexamita inflata TaxID=28002 RepID=A0AA86UEB3_9EUKA|nr:Hypothetical protein HINF_LOCUS39989 [Hexamita inflata]